METGIPFISALPVTEPLRYEYPARKRLTGLISLVIIDFRIGKQPDYSNDQLKYSVPLCYFVMNLVSLCGKKNLTTKSHKGFHKGSLSF
jgi:hypothetical protein